MPSNRPFYKTICMVVVLNEEPIQTTDLAEIACQGLIGGYSVAVSDGEITVLDGATAARELRAQHSDPAFFGLDDASEDLDAEPHLARPDRHTDGGPPMLQRATITIQVVFDDERIALTTLADQATAAARRAGAHDANADLGGQQTAMCLICGADMTLTDGEVAVHLDGDGNVDHDLDADHVALTPSDCYA